MAECINWNAFGYCSFKLMSWYLMNNVAFKKLLSVLIAGNATQFIEIYS